MYHTPERGRWGSWWTGRVLGCSNGDTGRGWGSRGGWEAPPKPCAARRTGKENKNHLPLYSGVSRKRADLRDITSFNYLLFSLYFSISSSNKHDNSIIVFSRSWFYLIVFTFSSFHATQSKLFIEESPKCFITQWKWMVIVAVLTQSYHMASKDLRYCTWPTCCINSIFVLFGVLNIWPLFPSTSGTEKRKLEWGRVNDFYFRRTVTLNALKEYSTFHVFLPNLHNSLHTRQMSNSCHTCSRPCWTVGSKQPDPISWKNCCLLRAPIALTVGHWKIK